MISLKDGWSTEYSVHINDKLKKNVVCFEFAVQIAGHIPSPLPVKWKSSISAYHHRWHCISVTLPFTSIVLNHRTKVAPRQCTQAFKRINVSRRWPPATPDIAYRPYVNREKLVRYVLTRRNCQVDACSTSPWAEGVRKRGSRAPRVDPETLWWSGLVEWWLW